MSIGKRMWKEASSLLVLAKNVDGTTKSGDCNYKILTMQRPQKSTFYPNAVVFPGGSIEKEDHSMDWIRFYKNNGITDDKFKQITDVNGPRSFIFQKSDKQLMPREISLRISAIRETFEEFGLLFCKSPKQFGETYGMNSTNYLTDFDKVYWQTQIMGNPENFLKLCQEYNVLPDLWSLYEWSVWLTPPHYFSKRYETAFFLIALNDQPEVSVTCGNEIQKFMWTSPQTIVQQWQTDQIYFPLPQAYEFSRLARATDFDKLINFAKSRNLRGSQLYNMIVLEVADGLVAILPGDDFYPSESDINYNGQQSNAYQYKNISSEEFLQKAKNYHRSYHPIIYGKCSIQMNIDFDDHLKPI